MRTRRTAGWPSSTGRCAITPTKNDPHYQPLVRRHEPSTSHLIVGPPKIESTQNGEVDSRHSEDKDRGNAYLRGSVYSADAESVECGETYALH